jgi:hypothetical protein
MEFYSGKIGYDQRKQVVDFGVLDTVAYSTGDILTSSALVIPSMARAQGMSGRIVRIMIKETTSGTLQRPSLRLWFFGAPLSPASRNAPQAFTSTQIDSLVGTIDVNTVTYINCLTGVASYDATVYLPYDVQDTSTALYVVPEVRAAYTFHSTARLIMQVVCEVD